MIVALAVASFSGCGKKKEKEEPKKETKQVVQEEEEPEILDPDHGKSEDDIRDEITGQMKLF